MNLLFFNTQEDTCTENRFCRLIADTLPEIRVKNFSQLPAFIKWLQVPPRDFFAVVMIPHDCESMRELVRIKPYFSDRKTIIILPESNLDAIDSSHKFDFNYIHRETDDFRIVNSLIAHWLVDAQRTRNWL